MTAAIQTLTLRTLDGSLAAALVDNVNYALREGGWALQVNDEQRSALGGRGPYADVEEQIAVDVFGATASAFLSAINTLKRLLRLADRFERFGEGQRVVLEIQLAGGFQLIAPVRRGNLEMPSDYSDLLMAHELSGATIRLVRGAWFETALDTHTAASRLNGNLITQALPATDYPNPTRMLINNVGSTTSIGTGVLVTAKTSSHITRLEVNSMTGAASAPYASVTDSTASGGSYTRLTVPSGGAGLEYLLTATPAVPATGRRFAVFATVLNNSLTAAAQLRLSLDCRGTFVDVPPIALEADNALKRVVCLGTFAVPTTITQFRLFVAGYAVGQTVELDRILIVCLDDLETNIIQHNRMTLSAMASTGSLVFDPGHVSRNAPAVYVQDGSGNIFAVDYQGDPYIVSSGANLYSCWFTTSANGWMAITGASNSSHTVTAERSPAWMTPV